MAATFEPAAGLDFSGHQVRLRTFQGPLDLLLHLVETQKIDIYDIPIATITDQYLQYLSALESLNLAVAGEFLVMAATLLQIKSRMLLPMPPAPADEPEPDPRAELVARLLEYRRLRQAALHLEQRQDLQSQVFLRAFVDGEGEQTWLLSEGHGPALLWAALREALQRARPVHQLSRARVTVGQRMAFLASLLRGRREGLAFLRLFGARPDRLEVIVTFLALLELMRLRKVEVSQQVPFGEIWIWWCDDGRGG